MKNRDPYPFTNLLSPEQRIATLTLGEWKQLYCDPQGLSMAHIICTNAGVGTIKITFNTYSGQSESISVTAEQKYTAVRLDLALDYGRDGDISEEDCAEALADRKAFPMWINDDRDRGWWGYEAQEDSPLGSYINLPNEGWYDFTDKMNPWSDHLEDRKPNCLDDLTVSGVPGSNGKVNGVRDLVDFFPVRLDLPLDVLDPQDGYDYVLVHPDGAVNFAYTPLYPWEASGIHRTAPQHASCFGVNEDESLDAVTTYCVGAQGVILNPAWLKRHNGTLRRPVIMIEGRKTSRASLVIEIRKGNDKIVSFPLSISVSPVKDMFRYLNLRTVDPFFTGHSKPAGPLVSTRATQTGLWPTRLNNPPNNPDCDLAKEGQPLKTIIFVHGVDWDHDETPAGHSEVFKRLYQSGSRARYIGVSWASDVSRRAGAPLAFGSDVIAAFVTAPHLKAGLANFSGPDTTIIAHSLGNMLISGAISDHGLSVGNYILLNAAMPVEAYDGRAASPDKEKMTHPDWKQPDNIYADRLMCAEWVALFPTNDPRHYVSWDGRFSDVMSKTRAWQFYSTGEEVLRQSEGTLPSVVKLNTVLNISINTMPFLTSDLPDDSVAGATEWVWVYNEMSKGLPGFLDTLAVDNHNHAGWRMNPEWDIWEGGGSANHYQMLAFDANGLSESELIAKPFFDRFQTDVDNDIPRWEAIVQHLYRTDYLTMVSVADRLPIPPLSAASTDQVKWHAKLLAEAVPPLSGPAGSIPVGKVIDDERAFDMMDPSCRDLSIWPDEREGKSPNQQADQRWLHGDYKDAPYLLTYRLYKKFVEISEQD